MELNSKVQPLKDSDPIGFLGHGFKHSAAIGETLVEQVIDGKSKIDISSFSLKRF